MEGEQAVEQVGRGGVRSGGGGRGRLLGSGGTLEGPGQLMHLRGVRVTGGMWDGEVHIYAVHMWYMCPSKWNK